ncbi:MAG: hypothetical protein ACRCTR_07235 [Actinomycetota bacterium]
MRTTLTIRAELLDAAKQIAVTERRSVSSVIEEAVQAMLARRAKTSQDAHFSLDTFRGGGYQAGVDITSNATVLDVMDRT